MLKKTIKYTDFNGDEQKEDFYFNLTKVELAELELSMNDGFSNHLKFIVATGDPAMIMRTFRMLLRKTVGLRSPDGKRFIKSDEIADAFEQSGAYSEFFLELIQNAQASVDFIRGVMPADLLKEADAQGQLSTAEKKPQDYTREEILAMDQDTFEKTFGTDIKKWPKSVLQAAMARASSL